MDYSRLDPVRRSVGPVHLDLVEAFATGKISRRQFMQRASVIGLSLAIGQRGHRRLQPSARLARRRARALRRRARRRVRARAPRARSPAAPSDARSSAPCRSTRSPCRTSAATASSPSRSSSCARRAPSGDQVSLAPGLATEWDAERRRQRLDVQAAPRTSKWQHDGSPFTAADVVASMERLVAAGNSGLKGVLGAGWRGRDRSGRPSRSRSRAPNGNFPYLVSIYNSQTVITPVDYVAGTTADAQPDRDRCLEAEDLRPARPARRSSGTRTGGAARRRSTARSSSSSTTRRVHLLR